MSAKNHRLFASVLIGKGLFYVNQYRPLQTISEEEIQIILASGSLEELLLLPLRVGEFLSDWKKVQDICLHLANAALGLAYVVRNKRRLEKHRVKPVMLGLLNNCPTNRGRIIDSIEDMNDYLELARRRTCFARYIEYFNNESKKV
ncbi:hypothetical protein IGI37_000636 [Enterococcus sp. AZ194]|uniref:hypothetical protein n=1 Tax=Enterococcus sp. AZ194 TaxID=2774629 RepID=UPI003F287547